MNSFSRLIALLLLPALLLGSMPARALAALLSRESAFNLPKKAGVAPPPNDEDTVEGAAEAYIHAACCDLQTAGGGILFSYLHNSKQLDCARGLYYLRARLMNPLTGRFWSADNYEGDTADPVSLHKYLYVGSDAVNGIDPSGNLTLNEVMIATAIVASLHAIAYATLRWSGMETDFGNVPDAGVIGIVGSSSRVRQWAGKLLPGSLALPPFVEPFVGAVGGIEVVFSIASAQMAVFAIGGWSLNLPAGDSAFLYTGAVWHMRNVDDYSGPFVSDSISGGGFGASGFTGPKLLDGPTGAAFGRVFGSPGFSLQGSATWYKLLYKTNYNSMAATFPMAAAWGAASGAIFAGGNPGVIGVSSALASFWPYAKWQTPAHLMSRQMEGL